MAQDLSGTWCAVANPQDCLELRQSGEAIQGTFQLRGATVGEATGWSRAGSISVAVRRLDTAQLAAFSAVLDVGGRLAARGVNAGGGAEWTGLYSRRGGGSSGPRCALELEPGVDRVGSDFQTIGTDGANACCPGLRTGPEVPGLHLGQRTPDVLSEIRGAGTNQLGRYHLWKQRWRARGFYAARGRELEYLRRQRQLPEHDRHSAGGRRRGERSERGTRLVRTGG